MRFEFLADRPDTIPVLARWYNDEWGLRLRNETLQGTARRLDQYLHRERIPFILVLAQGEELLAAAQLKYREMGEQYPEREHWLGGVFVAPEHRGRGLGRRIANEIACRAPAYGVYTLYLQTERLDGGLYQNIGWVPLERVEHYGVEVLVMARVVAAFGGDA